MIGLFSAPFPVLKHHNLFLFLQAQISSLVLHCRVVYSGTQNSFSMPVTISFWGKEENKSAVTDLMARRGYKLNSGGSEMMTSANKGPRESLLLLPAQRAFLKLLPLTQWFDSFR